MLDKRYVRYDNSLVISAFKAADFEPDIHSTTYKCQASNSLGTIVSRDIVINAGKYWFSVSKFKVTTKLELVVFDQLIARFEPHFIA